MPVSLRLPAALKQRVAKVASKRDESAHAFMLEAIREKLEAEEAQAQFQAEAEKRLAAMKRSGKGIPADEVFAYLRARASGVKAARPKARKIS